MTARRTRRISSSLFPANITPEMTSIQPGRVPWNMMVTGMRCQVSGGGGDLTPSTQYLAPVVVGWKGSFYGWAGQGNAGILRFFGGVPHIVAGFSGFWGPPREKGRNVKAFSRPRPPQGRRVNKNEPTPAPGRRPKMSKAGAPPTNDP